MINAKFNVIMFLKQCPYKIENGKTIINILSKKGNSKAS